ncbi:hypothetical protein Pcinc_025266 [Petrolisthes cinctipes]|uniref:Pro-resilin n=1 Tax=Petrolisthes cinctipes TaxID=88211 RepID=A0AAE1F940_PETCI|nr:hypothetical protein Pcinc_025266 [Petrolisthes cinctipes]
MRRKYGGGGREGDDENREKQYKRSGEAKGGEIKEESRSGKIMILLGVAALVAADSHSVEFRGYRAPRRYSSESYESSEANYDFDWAVRHGPSRNDFGQQETRNGDDTQGTYHVQLPDGRRQTVTYFVDGGSGYIADVKYDGSASFESGSFESGSFESGSFESYERPRPRYFYGSNESK